MIEGLASPVVPLCPSVGIDFALLQGLQDSPVAVLGVGQGGSGGISE